jgi:tubulin polyglutamylase TTLL9
MSRSRRRGGSTTSHGGSHILFRCNLNNTIYDVLRSRPGWSETSNDSDWDLNWAGVAWIRDNLTSGRSLTDGQRVNHFKNHFELTRKDYLIKNVKRIRKALIRSGNRAEAAQYEFCPTSFALPAEYSMFVEEFKRSVGQLWIMKPVGSAQGKGIFLINRLSQIADWKKGAGWRQGDSDRVAQYIVQRYVADPLTIGGKKFDMRIYVLVTSYSPLTAWLYRSGFCRFSTARYDGSREHMDNLYMHLTNNAIQKKSEDYASMKALGSADSKWPIRSLKMHIAARHGAENAGRCMLAVQNALIRTLLSVQKVLIQDRRCFELYGYDVMVDEQLRPWVLEANASPSLSASNAADYALKANLLNDTLNIVDVEGRRMSDETRVGGFDLVWQNGPVSATEQQSFLGCWNHQAKPVDEIIEKSFQKRFREV